MSAIETSQKKTAPHVMIERKKKRHTVCIIQHTENEKNIDSVGSMCVKYNILHV